MRAYFRLVRLPNTLTAVADVLAGAALAGATLGRLDVAIAALGSALLYAGGIALNDALDAEKDRELHPERPIPSGALSVKTATRLALLLLALGAGTGFLGDVEHRAGTAILIAMIVLYDFTPEYRPLLAALAMGGCRAFNLFRGLSLGDGIEGQWIALAMAGHAVLIFLISRISALEEGPQTQARIAPWCALMLVPYLVPGVLALGLMRVTTPYAILTALLGVALGLFVMAPGMRSDPMAKAVVFRGVFTLVMLDALLALAGGHPEVALILGLFLPIMRRIAALIGQRGS